MKLNRQEAQRVREPKLHELRQPFEGVGSPAKPLAENVPSPAAVAPRGWLGKLRQRVGQWLSTRSEPKITVITDQSGQTWWRAYNPCTQELKWLDSEDEVMLWLDAQAYF